MKMFLQRYSGVLIQIASVVGGCWYSRLCRRISNDGAGVYLPAMVLTGAVLLANLIWNSRFDPRFRSRQIWLRIGLACYVGVVIGEPFMMLVGDYWHFSGLLALVPLLLLIAEFARLGLWSATAAMSIFTAAGTAMFVSNSLNFMRGNGFFSGWLGN